MEKLNSINEALPSPTFAQDPPIATEEQPDYDDDGGNDMADIDNSDWDWGEPDPDYDPDEIDYTDALPEESLFPFSDGDDDDTEPEQVEEEEDCEDPDEEEY